MRGRETEPVAGVSCRSVRSSHARIRVTCSKRGRHARASGKNKKKVFRIMLKLPFRLLCRKLPYSRGMGEGKMGTYWVGGGVGVKEVVDEWLGEDEGVGRVLEV